MEWLSKQITLEWFARELGISSSARLPRRHFYMYVLFLEGGRRYVGITSKDDPLKRILQHYRGHGAKWTIKHKVLVTESINYIGEIDIDRARAIEHKQTKMLINKHDHNTV